MSQTRCRLNEVRAAAIWSGCLDNDGDGRSGLEKADRGVRRLWWPIRIKAKIVQGSPADRVCILVLSESLARPAEGVGGLAGSPRSTAVTCAIQRSVVRPAGMLRWRMKIEIARRNSAAQRNTERLNRAIEVRVIDRVLIVPDASARVCHLVSHEADALVPRVGFEATNGRSRPRVNGGSGL